MSAPAPATLRITDGCQGWAYALVAKSRAFQLTAEEARAAPDVVKGMYLLLISLFILNCFLMFIRFIFGSFLVKDISALIFFDSGATQSFISLALRKRFVGAPGTGLSLTC